MAVHPILIDGRVYHVESPKLETAVRRLNESAAALDRRLEEHKAERARALVDSALADGRIGHEERETWLRAFTHDFETVRSFLDDRQPDSARAMRNAVSDWSEEDEQLYREWTAAFRGIGAEDVL